MKNIKYLISAKYTALALSIIASFISSGVAMAGNPPAGKAYCFLSTTGITYTCGPGSGSATLDGLGSNDCTSIPIDDANNQVIPANCDNGALYQFMAGKCYIEGINPDGIDVWTQQMDCTSDDFNNVAPANTAMPTDITSKVPDNTQSLCNANSSTCDLTLKYINPIIAFLATAVGITVVISVVLGGIQYSAAGDNPQATAAAKRRIIGALLAAVCFLFLWGFLEFLIPGGLFNSP
jgi:sorbitol-specific phosphotransferase system component IIBC